jgi:hypothetical protein
MGKTVPTDNLQSGESINMDFSFWNIISHHGFSTVLTIVDAYSRFLWVFCTSSKKSPIHILRWFIANLRQEKIPLANIHVDEDGTLARSTAFDTFIRDEAQLNLETTGSYASFLNGKVERPNCTLAERSNCMILNAGAPAMNWCSTTEHDADIYRVTWNSVIKCSPHFTWSGESPNYKDMHIWGCCVMVPTHDLANSDKRATDGFLWFCQKPQPPSVA